MGVFPAPRLAALFAATWGLACTGAAAGEEIDIGGGLAFGTDFVFRGVSQTFGAPAAQASLSAEAASGLYGYVWGSNVDFVPDGEPDDGARLEIDIAIGWYAELSDRWSVDTAIVRYAFPGTDSGIDYDYSEVIATLHLDEQYHASVAYSNDVFGSGSVGVHGKIGATWDLPAATTLAVELGHYDLEDAYGASYSWTSVALGRRVGIAGVTASWCDTFDDAGSIFHAESTAARFTLTLDFEF